MAAPSRKDITIQNVRILWPHFSGEKDKFHVPGQRDFTMVFDQEVGAMLEAEGYNVSYFEPREEGEIPDGKLKVKVNFDGRPPKIVLITSRGRTLLDEVTAATLDCARIERADVIIRPYDWEVNGKTGRSAYLNELYVTIYESELDLKYADIEYV